jgi:aminoglycoside 6'-N-acetyltransferase
MPLSNVTLRKATIADLALLQGWDAKAHVIAATGADDAYPWADELPREVDWRELLIGEHEGRPVGVMQIIDPQTEETQYWGDIAPNLRAIDIWIGEERDLGRGYGTAMMCLAIERCFADPSVVALLVDPLAVNVRAHRFYERFGFKRMERRFFGEDDCFVYRITRDEHRRVVESSGGRGG